MEEEHCCYGCIRLYDVDLNVLIDGGKNVSEVCCCHICLKVTRAKPVIDGLQLQVSRIH